MSSCKDTGSGSCSGRSFCSCSVAEAEAEAMEWGAEWVITERIKRKSERKALTSRGMAPAIVQVDAIEMVHTDKEAKEMKNQTTLENTRTSCLSQEPDGGEVMNDAPDVRALVILSPTAGGQAVDRVMEIANSGRRRIKLYLKYVIDMDPVAEVFLDERQLEKMKKEGRETVWRQVERLRGCGVDAEVLPPHFGVAAEEILRVEEQLRPDIIVVGAPRTSTVKRLLWGDFCEDVVRQASTPVLTVRLNGERTPTCHRQVAVGQYAQAGVR